MFRKIALTLLASIGFQSAAFAQDSMNNELYIGGGVAINKLDPFDDATGFQIFGGMSLPFSWANASHSAELGYMDSGDFDFTATILGIPVTTSASVSGIWASYNLNWSMSENVNLLARVGYDAGDDDGVLVGGGVEFKFNSPFKARVEFVKRQNVDSIQLNVTYPL